MNFHSIRKFSFSSLTLCLIFLSFESCTNSSTSSPTSDIPFDIDQLPELSVESLSRSGELKPHPIEPILTFIPKEKFRRNKSDLYPPRNIAQHCQVSSYIQRVYFTQVTYPKVICYPNNAPTGQVVKDFIAKERGDNRFKAPENKIEGIKYYKLSSLQSQKINNPLFCSVHGGPWAAKIKEIGSCSSCGPGESRFELTVNSFPEIFIQWTGQLQDFPTTLMPNLQVFLNDVYLQGESRLCCPFYKNCNGSCIGETLHCGGTSGGI